MAKKEANTKNNAFRHINELIRAHRDSNVLFAAFELGVLEHVSGKFRSVKELSAELKIAEDGLSRLITALCALGLVWEHKKKFSLADPYDRFLDPKSPEYIGGLIKHEIHFQKRWLSLPKSVKTGQPVKKLKQRRNRMETHRFIKAMAAIGHRSAPQVLERIPFKGDEHLLDLGGGPGKYMEAFCQNYPKMELTLFDQPETIQLVKKNFASHKFCQRMHFISGDLLNDKYGKAYDVIFVSNVIHIFGQDELYKIFLKCHQALKPSGRLLIKDYFLTNGGSGTKFTTLFSLHMLLSSANGRCYTEQQLSKILEKAKFKRGKTIAITEDSIVLEGIRLNNNKNH